MIKFSITAGLPVSSFELGEENGVVKYNERRQLVLLLPPSLSGHVARARLHHDNPAATSVNLSVALLA